jgi:hypothetical protein
VKDYSVIVVDPGPHIMFNVICGETWVVPKEFWVWIMKLKL